MKHVFDYEAAPKEPVPDQCPACGAGPIRVWMTTEVDRYGYNLETWTCGICGHMWLAMRMTPAAYADFYASGAYRRLVSAFHGRTINDETIRPEQREYASKLSSVLRVWGEARGWSSRLVVGMLDVGGGNGEVASEIQIQFDAVQFDRTVLDPAPGEQPLIGGSVIEASAESFDPGARRWDLILLCQTIDHLLDPAGTLEKLRRALAPGGIFWVDALDYEITRELKIDHPHNFTERSLERVLDRTGWVTLARARWNRHVGFVCTA